MIARLRIWGVACLVALSMVGAAAWAQDAEPRGQFDTTDAMYAHVDGLVETRSITLLVESLISLGTVERQEMQRIELQVANAFPEPLIERIPVVAQTMLGGFHQELWAYTDGQGRYFYARLVYRMAEDGSVAIQRFNFNANIDALLTYF